MTLSDGVQPRHSFAAGRVLDPGRPLVVFGGGSPACAGFAGAQVVTASSGALGLNNGGDQVSLHAAGGTLLLQTDYGAEGGADESLVLSPDLNDLDPAADAAAGYCGHRDADDPGDRSPYSPATRIGHPHRRHGFLGRSAIAERPRRAPSRSPA